MTRYKGFTSRTVYFPLPSWIIDYESLQEPYIFHIFHSMNHNILVTSRTVYYRIFHYITHNLLVTLRTVYFSLSPSWVLDYESFRGPYIFRISNNITHIWVTSWTVYFQCYTYVSHNLWVKSRTVYFSLRLWIIDYESL